MGWFRFLLGKKEQQNEQGEKAGQLLGDSLDISQREARLRELALSADLTENIQLLTGLYGNSADLVVRTFQLGSTRIPGAIFCFEGMFDRDSLEDILRALEIDARKIPEKLPRDRGLLEAVKEQLLPTHEVREASSVEEICRSISSGQTALLLAGQDRALLCETRGLDTRAISEPASETTIRGPRDGFVENLITNISLIRRRLRTPNLWTESFTLGSLTRTPVFLIYIKGLVSEELLAEIRSRLERIKMDGVLESGQMEEYIQDVPLTIFPLVFRTEKPDRVISCLLEGKAAIITDGTPFVLVLPAQFIKMLEAPDDYYEGFPVGTLTRWLRFFSYLTSILLPGIYVAVVNFHQELIPTTLLLRITATREGLPFPVVAEALMMEFAFEVLREAGIRLPRAIGPAISIVGALVLGEAAIRAGIVSPVMIIVVALTAIASFTVPVFSIGISARILRFIFIGLGGAFGLFGIQMGIILGLIHLCSLRSFGIPYFSPIGPLIWSDWKDTFIRMYWWGMTTRPKLLGFREPWRAKAGQRPGPRWSREEEND
ncbi:MAG TPA: spore germination protein [Firmicutes bacterium]|nr:spore germination protein [Bacillota bacterium]